MKPNVAKRLSKGWGRINEILAIIKEAPLGRKIIEAGLLLRKFLLLNGTLFNSEAWQGVTAAQIVKLEKIDEDLLRGILKAHRKTPSEFLYLETGTLPVRFILAQRRINFLKHILSRDNEELIKRVYTAQKEDPTSGDFVKLVGKYLELLEITLKELTLGKDSIKNHKF